MHLLEKVDRGLCDWKHVFNSNGLIPGLKEVLKEDIFDIKHYFSYNHCLEVNVFYFRHRFPIIEMHQKL